MADRVSVWLLALSFSPFALETWLGGQLSVVSALAIAAALACHRTGRPGWAGFALAALLFKPTLLGLILLMLVIGRRWAVLLGFAVGGCLLAAISVAVVGIDGSFAYVDFLFEYGRLLEEHPGTFKAVKFIDLTTGLTLLGLERDAARIVALIVALPIIAFLALAWHRSRRSSGRSDLTWAATLCFVPLVTNYGAIYDAIVAVPGLILAADVIRRRHPLGWPAGFSAGIAAVYLSGMFSSVLAKSAGLQALTPGLAAAGVYLLHAALTGEETGG